MFQNDAERFAFIKEHLYVPAVCDVLDGLGYRQQAMHQRLRPLLARPQELRLRRPGAHVPLDGDRLRRRGGPLRPGDRGDGLARSPATWWCTRPTTAARNAPWGELMSTVAKRNGAVGCICDSQIRDCNRIIDMGFPVYYAGIRPLDSHGPRPGDGLRRAGRCGEVLVQPGRTGLRRLRRHRGRARRRGGRGPPPGRGEGGQGVASRARNSWRARPCARSTTSTACCRAGCAVARASCPCVPRASRP